MCHTVGLGATVDLHLASHKLVLAIAQDETINARRKVI